MTDKKLESIIWPDLPDRYVVKPDIADVTGLQTALDGKADTDGTIANAEQLHSTVGATDTEPFSFRTSGGSLNIGDREELELVGVDVGWNQLIYVPYADASKTENGVTIVDNRDGSYTVSTEPGGATADTTLNLNSFPMNGKYIITGCPKGGSISTYRITDLWTGAVDTGNGKIGDRNGGMQLAIKVGSGTVITTPIKFYPQATSLTSFLGSTIADYIYTLEQGTAGAGVAFFTKYFGTGYKAYDSGSLQSPVVKGIKMTGFNQWDEVAEQGGIDSATGQNATSPRTRSKNYINILPNTSYCYTCPNDGNYVFFYDNDKNYITYTTLGENGRTFITPNGARYLRFCTSSAYGTTYNHDICINLHWDGERDGEYEAYKEYYYPISPEPLHGIMTIEDGKLKADGDIRRADGGIDRRYARVDLGTLNWALYENTQTGYNYFRSDTIGSLIKPVSAHTEVPNIVCGKYITTNANSPYSGAVTKCVTLTTWGQVQIYDTDYIDAATFKTAMNGVYLVYELATTTTDTADPFTSPMIVDDWGTEEFIYNDGTTKFVPVGHSTKYLPNLKAKLEMSPDSPNGDGVYVVEQVGGINTYVPLASADTITNIITRLETLENA